MAKEAIPSPLVVVGSSAGGVEALSIFVSTLPAGFSAPVVIAQHLDPKRPSHLGEILARRCLLPLGTASDREPLVPGHVYVAPADRNVEIHNHELILREEADTPWAKPSISRLFSSAAQAYGEGLIAVVLTGTGTDGTTGALEVKKAGGTVVIQDPATASYPIMLRSLAPTAVDVAADIEQMGSVLLELITNPDTSLPAHLRTLNALLRQVKEQTSFDFTNYKLATIQRRVQRRIVATGSTSLAAYVRYLKRTPEEYARLISTFLIKVTEFFRDRQLFSALHDEVLPELIAQARERDHELRVWVAGCATGEEAYSVATQVADLLGGELGDLAVRIFATDLDAEAIAFARRGIYSPASLAGIPEDYRARYFTRVNGDFEVAKRVRSLVVFGQHDLGARAPFPNIDLLLCRNVLIYFTPELQRRVLHSFAYSLRSGGYLALGKAETAGSASELFEPARPAIKLYRRTDTAAPFPLTPTGRAAQRATTAGVVPALGGALAERLAHGASRVQTAAERLGALVFNLPVGVVVVDRRYDVQVINPLAHTLLRLYRPAMGEDLIHLADDLPTRRLRALIDAALSGNGPVPDSVVLPLEPDGGEMRYLRITAYPRRAEGDAGPAESVLLLIGDATGEEGRGAPGTIAPLGIAEISLAASDLAARQMWEAIEPLRARLARLMAANQELREANDQLIAANDELRREAAESLTTIEAVQASTAEVETLNQELQATNEELETLNEELQGTVEELNATNDDLEARSAEMGAEVKTSVEQARSSEAELVRVLSVLESLGDAALAVDLVGVPVYRNAAFTAAFGEAVAAARDWRGRPLVLDTLPGTRAARGETFVSVFSVRTGRTRRWYEAHGKPWRIDDAVVGGVVTFRDITDQRPPPAPESAKADVGG